MRSISIHYIIWRLHWIIGEFAEEDGIKDSEVKIECPACNSAMKILK